jgi:hypothetical protein
MNRAANYGMFSNRRPAGTSSASASITIVGKRGARLPRSIFEIAVVCRPVARDRSSCDQPRSARTSLTLAAKRSRGLTADSFRPLAQEAKRHTVNLRVECAAEHWRRDLVGRRDRADGLSQLAQINCLQVSSKQNVEEPIGCSWPGCPRRPGRRASTRTGSRTAMTFCSAGGDNQRTWRPE